MNTYTIIDVDILDVATVEVQGRKNTVNCFSFTIILFPEMVIFLSFIWPITYVKKIISKDFNVTEKN